MTCSRTIRFLQFRLQFFNRRQVSPELEYVDSLSKACEDADLVLHLTEWREYREADPMALAAIVRARRVLDARNLLPVGKWLEAGWTVRTMGGSLPLPAASQ